MQPNALLLPYWGIGDAIYLNPVVRKIARRHEFIYGCTPFPVLWTNIPNFRPLHPWTFPGLCSMPLYPMYYDAVYGVTGWQDVAFKALKRKECQLYDPSHNGEGFAPGANLIDHCLVGESPDDCTLWFPPLSNVATKAATEFINTHNPTGKPPLLFHPHMHVPGEVLHPRCAPDSVALEMFHALKKDFFLFDATRWISEASHLVPQADLPIFHSSAWIGLEIAMALINRCVGVAMQGSCSLFVLAQIARKPILCGNGACHPGIEHLSSPRMPEAQRRIVALEPDDECRCNQNCGATKRTNYRTKEALSKFLQLLG